MLSERKWVILSVETKYKIMKKLRNGQNAINLTQKYGVEKSTVSGIKNKE